MQRIADFLATLMAGGTVEIILLIVLVIVGLILLLVGLWLAWKLLGLLGKGLKWLFQRGGEAAQARSITRREAELSKPPLVATGWGSSGRLGLRIALGEAIHRSAPDAMRIVVVAGQGGCADLCRSLGIAPSGAGRIGIAAGADTILIDASRASNRELRRLARALPWRRPLDGVAILVGAEGLPADGVARAASLARATGVKAALHLVLPSSNAIPAWRIIDSTTGSGDAICSQLAADSVRIWLVGGDRHGFEELARAQSRDLPAAIDRAMAVAPAALLDIASLAFSGTGLRGAVAQSVARTKPATTPGILSGTAYGAFAVGIALTIAAGVQIGDRVDQLRGVLSTASREAAVPWTAEGIQAMPNGARVQRLAGVGTRLAEHSDFPLLTPLAPMVPDWAAPARLARAFLSSYVLRPVGAALERKGQFMLKPHSEASRWIEDARQVGEWTAAWEGLSDDPREVDLQALLSDAFGGVRRAWPADLDLALVAADVDPPPAAEGGLDVAGLTDLARANFTLTMQHWATRQYTNGPVASAARRAGAGGVTWREQHTALIDLRDALQSPDQQWLTAAEDRSDHAVELRLLGRALALGIIGQVATVEAKAEVARIRIDAREQATHFTLPEIGALLERSGSGSGPSLTMTAPASAWLMFLDRIANAGFAQPQSVIRPVLPGLVTIDRTSVAQARERLRVFDRFSANLAADIPPGPAQKLLQELDAELVVGVATAIENSLRQESNIGVAAARAERRAEAAAAFRNLDEIEIWLRDRQAHAEADRVGQVRARVAEGILAAAAGILEEEQPLAAHLDPTADGDALVRRFERGVQRKLQIHEQFVAPYLDAASARSGTWTTLHWRDISRDLEAYARGDADSTVSALEGSIRAYSEDADAACGAPKLLLGRGDYLARAASQFRNQVDQACERAHRQRVEAAFGEVASYFNDHVRDFWPYARNPDAPEVSVASLGEFLRRLHQHSAAAEETTGPLADLFTQHAGFWEDDHEGGAVRFQVGWRWRRGEEHLAEHVVKVSLEGVETDEAGFHTWRYGTPFAVRLRLAKNSTYRFVLADGRLSDEWVLSPPGHGALLRALTGLSGGAMVFEADVAIDHGEGSGSAVASDQLRLSARFTHEDGRGITMPSLGGGPSDPRR